MIEIKDMETRIADAAWEFLVEYLPAREAVLIDMESRRERNPPFVVVRFTDAEFDPAFARQDPRGHQGTAALRGQSTFNVVIATTRSEDDGTLLQSMVAALAPLPHVLNEADDMHRYSWRSAEAPVWEGENLDDAMVINLSLLVEDVI